MPSSQVSSATLYNWRRTYGGMDVDAAKELKELRERNSRLKRLLAEAELEKDALREVAKGNSEPSCQAPRRGHAQGHVGHVRAVGVQSSWACPFHLPPPPASADAVRSGCRDEGLAARLRDQTSPVMDSVAPGQGCATTSAVRSTRRRSTACGAKRVHRSKVVSPRKRAGVSSVPPAVPSRGRNALRPQRTWPDRPW